jgi:hypothetical protein
VLQTLDSVLDAPRVGCGIIKALGEVMVMRTLVFLLVCCALVGCNPAKVNIFDDNELGADTADTSTLECADYCLTTAQCYDLGGDIDIGICENGNEVCCRIETGSGGDGDTDADTDMDVDTDIDVVLVNTGNVIKFLEKT